MNLRAKRIAAWAVWSATAIIVIGILVGLLAWGIVATQNASERRDNQIAALVKTVSRNDRSAATDRATAAANQKALLDYTAALAARQDALLNYLRVHGIHIPQHLVTVIPPPRIVVRHPRVRRGGSRAHHHASTPQPGKSGGHRKRPHKRH
jgi:hypothetical protein